MNKYQIITNALKSLVGVLNTALPTHDTTRAVSMYEEELLKNNKLAKLFENIIIPDSKTKLFNPKDMLNYKYFKQKIRFDIKNSYIAETIDMMIEFSREDSFNHLSEGDIIRYASNINIVSVLYLIPILNSKDSYNKFVLLHILNNFTNKFQSLTQYELITVYNILRILRKDPVNYSTQSTDSSNEINIIERSLIMYDNYYK